MAAIQSQRSLLTVSLISAALNSNTVAISSITYVVSEREGKGGKERGRGCGREKVNEGDRQDGV